MSHTLSKSRLCVYISDGCVKILLGWITNWPGWGVGGGGSSPHTLLSSQFQRWNPAYAEQSQRVGATDSILERGRKLKRLRRASPIPSKNGHSERNRSTFQELR